MDDQFPEDMNSEIFSRLPVKPLLKARSLCRGMRDLTHNPIFVEKHRKFSSQRNPNLILTDHKCREGNNLNNNINSLYCVQNEETPNHYSCNKVSLEIPDFKEFRLVGSCNGLICLVHPTKKYEICVCNPCTGKYNKIPPPVSIVDRPLDMVVGFGVIPETNIYKVVAIVDSPEHGDFHHLVQKVFVYTLGDTNWILLEDNRFVLRLEQSPSCKAFVNGALHWVSDAKLIVSFNMHTNKFDVVPRPELELGRGGFYLRVFDGKLMILNTSFGDRIEMWVMKDYGVVDSWTRTFTVNERHIGRNILNARIECFLENGDVLMVYDHQALLCYNLQSALVSELIIDGLPKWFHAIAHVGTLVSPLLPRDEQIELDERDLDE